MLEKRTETLGLDLAVFSYYQQGKQIPSVAEARAKAKAAYAAVKALPTLRGQTTTNTIYEIISRKKLPNPY